MQLTNRFDDDMNSTCLYRQPIAKAPRTNDRDLSSPFTLAELTESGIDPTRSGTEFVLSSNTIQIIVSAFWLSGPRCPAFSGFLAKPHPRPVSHGRWCTLA